MTVIPGYPDIFLKQFWECPAQEQEAWSPEVGRMDRNYAYLQSISKCLPWALCFPLCPGGSVIYQREYNGTRSSSMDWGYTNLVLVCLCSSYFIWQWLNNSDFFSFLFVASGKPLSRLPDQKSSLSDYRQFKYFPLPDHLSSHTCPHRLLKGLSFETLRFYDCQPSDR